MGNRKSYPNLKVSQGFQPSDWKFCSSGSEYEIIANIRNGQLAQVHQLSLDATADYSDQLHKYEYRRTQKQNLVQVLNVQRNDDDFNCSAKTWLKVIIERVSYRLSEIKNLTPEEGLYVLKRSLIGFKAIQELNGCMRIDDSLICITPDGRIKVWLNDDLARNQPEEGRLLGKSDNPQQAQSNQISMVNQIVKEVWLHVCPGLRHSNFMEAYQKECESKPDGGLSFFEALNFLEDYMIDNDIQLPDGIRMPNKVHKVMSNRSDLDSASNNPAPKNQTEKHKDSKLSLKNQQLSPRYANTTASQKVFSNFTFNKNVNSKLSAGVSTGVSTGVSASGVPQRVPMTSNPPSRLHALDRLNKQMGMISHTSLNTIDQVAGIEKIRSVGRSNQFAFNQSQVPVIHPRMPSIREQVVQERPSVKFSYNSVFQNNSNIQAVLSDRPRPVSNSPMVGIHGLRSAGVIPSATTETINQRSTIENPIKIELSQVSTTPRYEHKQSNIQLRQDSLSHQTGSVSSSHIFIRTTPKIPRQTPL